VNGAEELAFFSGSGVGQPLGVKGHDSVKTVTRDTASHVKWADIKNMFARVSVRRRVACMDRAPIVFT